LERWLRLAIVAASGVLLWAIASLFLGRAEPWDAPGYWYAYTMAVGLSGVWGYVFRRRAWLWGPIIMFAQAPVMWFNNAAVGSLAVLGLILIGIMSIPAMGAGVIGSGIALRRQAQPR
jgi:hypothetical protein